MIIRVIARVMLPFIIRGIENKNPFYFEWDGIMFTVFEAVGVFLYCWWNYLFIYAGVLDFTRRLYMIKAVGSLISPTKDNYGLEFRIYPTINITCKQSLATWI